MNRSVRLARTRLAAAAIELNRIIRRFLMEHRYETDPFPFVRARWFTDVTQRRNVRLIVIHTTEAFETSNSAEGTAQYFRDPRDKFGNIIKVSSHLCIDSDSVVQCVWDKNIAYTAPGVNHDGIHLELAGTSAQTSVQWADAYSTLVLEKAAFAAAQYCLKYDIPRGHLTNQQLRHGQKGIIGHVQASEVYPPNNGHTDPGPNFPWNFFINRVQFHYAVRKERLDNLT